MKPPLISEGLIRVTHEWLEANPLSEDERRTLTSKMSAQSICPRNYYFEDCPEVRRVLKLEEQAP